MQGRDSEIVSLKVKSKRLPQGVANWLRRSFNRLLGIEKFNTIYRQLPPYKDTEIGRAFFDTLNIKVEMDGTPIGELPAKGPLIFVANHPHGIADGLAIDILLRPNWPDGALMAVYVLGDVPEFRKRLILVDPQKRRSRRGLTLQGWREAYKLLLEGRALATFPAGSVSRFQWRGRSVSDREWSPHIAGLARRTNASVVPVFIHGGNSWLFQAAGLVSQQLQNLLIFGEFPKMHGKTFRMTLGRLIPPEDLTALPSDEAASAFLRQQVYELAKA